MHTGPDTGEINNVLKRWAGLLLTVFSWQPAVAAELTEQQARAIEHSAQEWMQQHDAPSVSIAVVLDGQLVWERAFGVADAERKTPATPATVYRLASVTKSMTATAVMQLVEHGKIDLDAPIQRYCPEYPAKQWPVTARRLMAHLAGVRHYSIWEWLWPNITRYSTVKSSLEIFKNDDLLHRPGEAYKYSTYGYSILGCAIEGASGKSYAAYMRDHIFLPSQMAQTEPDDSTKAIPRRATLYSKGFIYRMTGMFPMRTSAAAVDTSDRIPGGGLVSTAADMARFAIAVQDERLVGSHSLNLMWTRQKTNNGALLPFYGLGWLIGDRSGSKALRVWNDGSQPGTRTYLYMMPEKRFAIALMTNMDNAPCEELVPGIRKLLGVDK